MKRATFVCPLCGHKRVAAAARQWCKRGHQHAQMRPASVRSAATAAIKQQQQRYTK